jgi:transcriptional regulator with GAF, ATPase, and Fis domain
MPRQLLPVWKEVCRNIRLEESIGRVAPLLRQWLPVDEVLVRVLDIPRACLDTVAVAVDPDVPPPARARSDCSQAELDRIVAWCQSPTVEHDTDRRLRARWPGLLPAGVAGDVLAGPLRGDDNLRGVLLLVALRPNRFDESHVELARALLDPFAVALENDHRVRELLTLREAAEADNRSLLSKLGRHDISDSIVGSDTGLREVMEHIGLVARSDAPVLVLGETGSGKEVVARAIHNRSPRASGPFLRVNCGAIPPELIDSELFGHERGSFSGAIGERRGWFERADGGTLFLDECGELTPAAQVRLLRVLQDGQFERVGGEKSRHVDVRIVAATHRDLAVMVQERAFRQDLWYRLAVFPIKLPPLRERRSDIPQLAAHFALRAATRLGFPPRVPTDDDVALLVAYHWPGNVRELAAVIERAAILGGGKTLAIRQALGHVQAPSSLPAQLSSGDDPDPSRPFATLEEATRVHIEAALRRTRGQVEGAQGAAALLGINPHTLRSKMKKLHIDWSVYRDG